MILISNNKEKFYWKNQRLKVLKNTLVYTEP